MKISKSNSAATNIASLLPGQLGLIISGGALHEGSYVVGADHRYFIMRDTADIIYAVNLSNGVPVTDNLAMVIPFSEDIELEIIED